MRKLVLAIALVLLTPVVLAAQNAPKFEVGTKTGITYVNSDFEDVFVIGIPGAAPFNIGSLAGGSGATVHFGFFPHANFALRPELGLGFTDVSNGGDASLLSVVLSLQGEYYFTGVNMNSGYVGGGLAMQYFDIDDGGFGGGFSDEDFAVHLALGYRFLPLDFLALALEARYRRWFDFELNEIGLGLTMAVVVQ